MMLKWLVLESGPVLAMLSRPCGAHVRATATRASVRHGGWVAASHRAHTTTRWPACAPSTHLAVVHQLEPAWVVLERPSKHRVRLRAALVDEGIDDAVKGLALEVVRLARALVPLRHSALLAWGRQRRWW
jgi:hypothetical protein